MSLKSSEINNYSWTVSAVLLSPFAPPLRNLWKLTLKMFLNSPEMNCSIMFSLYLLRMSKKMGYFLRNVVRRERERVIPGSISIQFFHLSEWCSVNNQQVLFFAVLLLPLIGMQNPSHSVVTLVLRADLLEFLFHCCSNRSQTYLFHEKFWSRSECCLLFKDQILISTPCLPCR